MCGAKFRIFCREDVIYASLVRDGVEVFLAPLTELVFRFPRNRSMLLFSRVGDKGRAVPVPVEGLCVYDEQRQEYVPVPTVAEFTSYVRNWIDRFVSSADVPPSEYYTILPSEEGVYIVSLNFNVALRRSGAGYDSKTHTYYFTSLSALMDFVGQRLSTIPASVYNASFYSCNLVVDCEADFTSFSISRDHVVVPPQVTGVCFRGSYFSDRQNHFPYVSFASLRLSNAFSLLKFVIFDGVVLGVSPSLAGRDTYFEATCNIEAPSMISSSGEPMALVAFLDTDIVVRWDVAAQGPRPVGYDVHLLTPVQSVGSLYLDKVRVTSNELNCLHLNPSYEVPSDALRSFLSHLLRTSGRLLRLERQDTYESIYNPFTFYCNRLTHFVSSDFVGDSTVADIRYRSVFLVGLGNLRLQNKVLSNESVVGDEVIEAIFSGFSSLKVFVRGSEDILLATLRYNTEEHFFLPLLVKNLPDRDYYAANTYPILPSTEFVEFENSAFASYSLLDLGEVFAGDVNNFFIPRNHRDVFLPHENERLVSFVSCLTFLPPQVDDVYFLSTVARRDALRTFGVDRVLRCSLGMRLGGPASSNIFISNREYFAFLNSPEGQERDVKHSFSARYALLGSPFVAYHDDSYVAHSSLEQGNYFFVHPYSFWGFIS